MLDLATTRVPAEFLGLARAFRTEVRSVDIAMDKALDQAVALFVVIVCDPSRLTSHVIWRSSLESLPQDGGHRRLLEGGLTHRLRIIDTVGERVMAPPLRKIAFVMASTQHGTMIVNRFDYKMTTPDDGFGVGYMLFNNSGYDLDEVTTGKTLLDARRRHFGDGVRVLDIGANIGVFTVEWARHMHGWGDVQAFEAQEPVFHALAGNIAINNCFNARPLCAAVTRLPGTMRVPLPDYFVPGSFGSLELRRGERNEDIGQPISYSEELMVDVPAVSVDSLALKRLDLMKVDVEGMEIEVLEGCRQTIAQSLPILIVENVKIDQAALNGQARVLSTCAGRHSPDPEPMARSRHGATNRDPRTIPGTNRRFPMLNTHDTATTAREITGAELDLVTGGITKETLAVTAVCLLSPAFLLGFSAVVAVRTLTE